MRSGAYIRKETLPATPAASRAPPRASPEPPQSRQMPKLLLKMLFRARAGVICYLSEQQNMYVPFTTLFVCSPTSISFRLLVTNYRLSLPQVCLLSNLPVGATRLGLLMVNMVEINSKLLMTSINYYILVMNDSLLFIINN